MFGCRGILAVQRIVRVSPAPWFVSSVSWHRARPPRCRRYVPLRPGFHARFRRGGTQRLCW